MSLVPNPEMTEKNLAAHRSNGRKSRGAATAEGKERARAANLRHGYYSQIRNEALEALGEDPAALAALIEGANEQWRPVNAQQAAMVEQMARLQWRMQRADRLQESVAAQHVKEAEERRAEKISELSESYVNRVDFLWALAQHVARPDFFASPVYLQECVEAFTGRLEGTIEHILVLLHRLQKPPNFEPTPGPLPEGATSDDEWRWTLEAQAEKPEVEVPLPDLPLAAGAERDELREKLRELAVDTEEALTAAWKEALEEREKSMSSLERDVAAAQVAPQLVVMRRDESACFREFWRLGTFLMKMQDRTENESEVRGPKSDEQKLGARSEESVPYAVAAISDSRRRGAPGAREMRRSLPASGQAPTAATAGKAADLVEQVCAAPAARSGQALSSATGGHPIDAEKQLKNEGASGDIAENKGEAKSEAMRLPGSLATETPSRGDQFDVEAA